MKRKIGKVILFLFFTVLMLQQLNQIFRLKQEDGIYPMEIFYEQEKDSIDVIFYGSSHTYSDINPAVLWREEGIASFDLAGSLQPLWNTYYYMKESLKYQHPKVMVVELVRAIEEREYIEDARTITNTFGMKFSKEKYEAVRVSTPNSPIPYLLGYPIYHSRYAELSREDFEPYRGDPNGENYKGFYPLFAVKSFEELSDMSGVKASAELSPKTQEYLYKIIELAQEEEIPLIFMVSPYQGIIESEQMVFNRCREIAEENGIPFLDFNLLYEELELDPGRDFAEFSHLNHRGSTKLSAWLAHYLKEEYQLPEHWDNESYEKNAVFWERRYANQLLREEGSWERFLEKLSENTGYAYMVSLNGAYGGEEMPMREELLQLHVDPEVIQQGGFWIHSPEEDQSFPGQGETAFHMELDHSDLVIRKNGEQMQILLDGEPCLKTLNGVNIFVYDTNTQEFVTAVGFDAQNDYVCIY